MRLWFYGHFARHGGCYTCTFWDILSLVNLKLSLASWLLSDIFLGIIIYKIILCLHAEFLIYMHQSINVRNFRMHWGLDMCSSQNKVHLHCLPYTSEPFLHKHKSTGILSNLTTNFILFNFVLYRCVICQMEYKRGDRRITLPCKHAYHASCGTKWLSINKVSYCDF